MISKMTSRSLGKGNAVFHSVLSLLAGAFLPMAFAPFHLFWLAICCPAALLLAWHYTHKLTARMWRGFLFGLGFFGVGVSWVYVSIHEFGQVGIFLTALITIGFIIMLALLFLVQAIAFHFCFSQQRILLKNFIAFPVTWVLFEWMRGWLFTGFPWLYLGYSQTNSPLAGYTPVLGCFGVSLITILMAGCVTTAILYAGKKRLWSLLMILALLLVGNLLFIIRWTHVDKKHPQALSVSLIQGNIPQSMKWQPDQVQPTLNKYTTLTQEHWANLVVWPEAAIPITFNEALPYLNKMSLQAEQHHSTLITGIPAATLDQKRYYNAAIAIGQGAGLYAKRHLVPFGEYIPLHPLFGNLLKFFDLPMLDSMQAGQQKQPLLRAGHLKIGSLICYEVAYNDLTRTDLPQANLLINLSNDAWFGHSFASEQQLQMAQMRALEAGRYLLAVTNNGVTAVINQKGKCLKSLPRYQTGVLTGNIHAFSGKTPWTIWGNWPVMSLVCLLFLIGLASIFI